ncbi:SCO2521 family protein [Microbispora sp. ATCC PTA-5024]|uniref:SCO2521 family protein n=1 Tax=Microbispora sp. ATCC PTA-5024 TaxID=316330 RepID=UPI0018DCC581|nr:SCO2521 family protein [Microbispora sp. ATCC PTA-5024]
MGEVHTGLLQNSGEIEESTCRQVLALMAGETVRVSRRPIVHAVSPDRLTGVDCRLPSATQSRVRGVGTVLSRCAITGGRVAQGSSYVRLTRAEADRRLPWSHYLARPGVVEVLGKAKERDLADGFAEDPPHGCLDLGAISGRLLDLAQSSPLLDRRAPFRVPRTRLRWAAESGEPAIRFVLRSDQTRSVLVVHDGAFTPAVAELCEDLALHDWLLTTLLVMVERARIGAVPGLQAAARLAPAVDHLLHLWMPAARLGDAMAPYWESLDRRPGFSRQWQSLVDRVRDQMAVTTLALLRDTAEAGRRRR